MGIGHWPSVLTADCYLVPLSLGICQCMDTGQLLMAFYSVLIGVVDVTFLLQEVTLCACVHACARARVCVCVCVCAHVCVCVY